MDFFSTEASTKFCNRFEGAHSLQKASCKGVSPQFKAWETRNQLPPKSKKVQNFNSPFSAGCPHTSPRITEHKSWMSWSTCHLFSWNWDNMERRREGWYGQKLNTEKADVQKGRFSFQLWVYLPTFTTDLQKQNASTRVKVKSQDFSILLQTRLKIPSLWALNRL